MALSLSQIAANKVEQTRSQISALMASIEADEREPDETESAQLAAWTADLDTALARAEAQRALDERVSKAETVVAALGGTAMEIRNGATLRVGNPVDPYPEGHGWLTDFALASTGNRPSDRWEQYSALLAATTTGDLGAGLVPPTTLTNRIVEIALGRRDVLRAVPKLPLTATGMTIWYPRWTQGPSAGVHTQGSDLGTRNPQAVRNEIPVVAVGGYVPLQWIALTRGTINEATVVRQIGQQIGVELNRQVTIGDSGAGEHDGLATVAGISESAASANTLGKFRKLVIKQKNLIHAARDVAPTHLIIAPAMAELLESATDTDGRAILAAPDVIGAVNAVGSMDSVGAGRFAGLTVLVDPNLTGESSDTALVVLMDEVVLFGGDAVNEFRTEHARSATVDVSALSVTAFGVDHTHAVAKLTAVVRTFS